jgi:hypothetical protein
LRGSGRWFQSTCRHPGADLAGYDPPSAPTFPDVPTDHWAFKEIEYLSSGMNASGGVVVSGYGDGKYHPEYTVNRGQMAVFIARGFAVPQ